MRLILNNKELDESIESLLRQAGYNYFIDKNTGNESFVRPLNRGYYPRFHLYLANQGDKIIINLHLDQKQASYAGARAHNAEYDGEVVTAEMERIKRVARHAPNILENADDHGLNKPDVLDKIRSKHFEGIEKRPPAKKGRKSWWRFWK